MWPDEEGNSFRSDGRDVGLGIHNVNVFTKEDHVGPKSG